MIPKLQVAMDNLTLESVIAQVYPIGEIVDIIEIGTVLHLSQGMKPLSIVRQTYGEDKLILSDLKCADAGETLARQSFTNGANQVTAICCADIETIELMNKVAKEYDGEIHIELYGDYTEKMINSWIEIGIEHVIYHRSRDAQLQGRSWSEVDLNKIKYLIAKGLKVTVTGGLKAGDIEFFKGLEIYCFIAGRGIREAEDSYMEAKLFKQEIERVFS